MSASTRRVTFIDMSDTEDSSYGHPSPPQRQDSPECQPREEREASEERHENVNDDHGTKGDDPIVQQERIRRDQVMRDQLANYLRQTRPLLQAADWYETQLGMWAQTKAELPQEIAELEAKIEQKKGELQQVEKSKRELRKKLGAKAKAGKVAKGKIEHVEAWLNMECDYLPAGFEDDD